MTTDTKRKEIAVSFTVGGKDMHGSAASARAPA